LIGTLIIICTKLQALKSNGVCYLSPWSGKLYIVCVYSGSNEMWTKVLEFVNYVVLSQKCYTNMCLICWDLHTYEHFKLQSWILLYSGKWGDMFLSNIGKHPQDPKGHMPRVLRAHSKIVTNAEVLLHLTFHGAKPLRNCSAQFIKKFSVFYGM
jgi:hypothetical protein